jgi:hypothetical protein
MLSPPDDHWLILSSEVHDRTDLTITGAESIDREVVVDGNPTNSLLSETGSIDPSCRVNSCI